MNKKLKNNSASIAVIIEGYKYGDASEPIIILNSRVQLLDSRAYRVKKNALI